MPDISTKVDPETGVLYKCDVHNGRIDLTKADGTLESTCGNPASTETDGNEEDQATTLVPVDDLYGLKPVGQTPSIVKGKVTPHGVPKKLGRKAVPHVRVCEHHENWPFSEDAKRFADTPPYKKRLAAVAKGNV